MKKGQILEGTVERVDFPNKGRVRISGEDREVTVKNAIPGQKVQVCVNKIRAGRAQGRLLEVLAPSPLEIPSPCPHFGQCGGCTYQTLPYEEQLKLKEAQVKGLILEAVEKGGGGAFQWDGIKASPRIEGYRNKMEFTFGDAYKDGPMALGMHKRGSFHDIVSVSQCRIVDEDFRKILEATLAFAGESGLPYYHRMRHTGYFRHLLVRKAVKTGEILVDLVTTTQAAPDLASWADRLQALEKGGQLAGRIDGILHTSNDSLADAVKDEGTEVLRGEDHFYEELLGLRFKITPLLLLPDQLPGRGGAL